MIALFHDMICHEIEVYVDDMITKSKEEGDHLVNLGKMFYRLKKYQLKLNPSKCIFGPNLANYLASLLVLGPSLNQSH